MVDGSWGYLDSAGKLVESGHRKWGLLFVGTTHPARRAGVLAVFGVSPFSYVIPYSFVHSTVLLRYCYGFDRVCWHEHHYRAQIIIISKVSIYNIALVTTKLLHLNISILLYRISTTVTETNGTIMPNETLNVTLMPSITLSVYLLHYQVSQ